MSDLVTTADGSVTRYNAEFGELYHNRAGAYTEAFRNYVEPSEALKRLRDNGNLTVIDACFGLGYNTLVLVEELAAADAAGSLSVIAVETDGQILKSLSSVLQDPRLVRIKAAFGERQPVEFGQYRLQLAGGNLTVTLDLLQQDLRQFLPECQTPAHLVFHDPFSPRKVPQLWTVDLFRQYFRILSHFRGALLTYSSAGAVRGGLAEAGFRVFRTAALGAKSGGTLATTDAGYSVPSCVHRLSDEELERCRKRSGVPYRDLNFSATNDDIIKRRTEEQLTI